MSWTPRKSKPNDAQSTKDGWQGYVNVRIVFNSLSAAFFLITIYLLLSFQEWSATGRAGVSFLCAFSCAVIGNLDRFKSVKASLSGIEAKTREIEQEVDKARVAIREFHTLAEMTGSMLIELMAGAGRLGGNPQDYDYQRRQRVIDALTAIGLTKSAINRVHMSDAYWVKIDYSLAIFGLVRKSQATSPDLKEIIEDMNKRWNSEDFRPMPNDFDRALKDKGGLNSEILDLVEDYRYYAEHAEHRRPDVWRNRKNW